MEEIINISTRLKPTEFEESKNPYAVEFLKKALNPDISIKEFNELFLKLLKASPIKENYTSYVGQKENNSSNIDVSSDPGRALIERITNGIDSVLEDIYNDRNSSINEDKSSKTNVSQPQSPHQAAQDWLGVPIKDGLKALSDDQRMKLAKKVLTVRQLPGDSSSDQIIDIIDRGIGINQKQFKDTILSISGSNKIRKKYVMGQYGHGGSSTFRFSKKTLIVSKTKNSNHISFTVVWYQEPEDDDDTLKIGSYIYLTENNFPLSISAEKINFDQGTTIRHFGYDASKYKATTNLGSIYGLCERRLFNAPIPFVIYHPTYKNRSMIGARASLMGAYEKNNPKIKIEVDHYQPKSCLMISDGQLGKVWVEYWLASADKRVPVYNKEKKKTEMKPKPNPVKSKIDMRKPIIFTNNGQNQHEENSSLIATQVGLPFLKNRLVVHVDCNDLSPKAKRIVFTSTREKTTQTAVTRDIINQIIAFIKSDDQLKALNDQAAEEEAKQSNLHNKEFLQKEVAKFLMLKGGDLKTLLGYKASGTTPGDKKRPRPPSPRPKPIRKDIKLNDPPSYIKLLWEDDKEIKFYKGRERWIRLETDAYNFYNSKINVSIIGEDLEIKSRTDLSDGRMRFQVKCTDKSLVKNSGSIKVELKIQDTETILSDQRNYIIVEVPEEKPNTEQPTQPDYECIPVQGKSDPVIPFERLFDNEEQASIYEEEDVAFSYEFNNGKIIVYYNTEFKNFKSTIAEVKRKSTTAKAETLQGTYEVHLCAMAYLDHNEKENNKYREENSVSNTDDKNFADELRIKNNAAAGASLLMIMSELFKRNKENE